MTVQIRLESPVGTTIGRQLEVGQGFRITGTYKNPFPVPFEPMECDLWPTDPEDAFSPYHAATGTNIAGNFWYDIPEGWIAEPCQAKIRVCAKFILTECSSLNIGVGTVAPQPNGGSWYDRLLAMLGDSITDVGKVMVAGGTLIGVLWIMTGDSGRSKKEGNYGRREEKG